MSEPFQNLLIKEWNYERGSMNFTLETTCPSSNIFPSIEPHPSLLALGIEFPPDSSHYGGIPTIELDEEYLGQIKAISVKGMESNPTPMEEF